MYCDYWGITPLYGNLLILIAAYTAAELIVLITSAFAACGGMFVAIITAWRTGTKVDATDKKVATTVTEIGKVHTLVNDRTTQQDRKIETLQETIKILIASIATKDQNSAILADRKVQNESSAQGVQAERTRVQEALIKDVVIPTLEVVEDKIDLVPTEVEKKLKDK